MNKVFAATVSSFFKRKTVLSLGDLWLFSFQIFISYPAIQALFLVAIFLFQLYQSLAVPPHTHTLAAFIPLLPPIIMEFNAQAALPKYVGIAKAMNVYKDSMTQEEVAKAAVEAVKSLSIKVGIRLCLF